MHGYFIIVSCRRFASALIVAAIAAFAHTALVSANEPEIFIPDVVVEEGGTAVTVMIRSFESVGGINLALLVDSDYVEFAAEDAQWGTLSLGASDILHFVPVWCEDVKFQAAIFVWDGSASGDQVLFTVPLRPVKETPQPAPRFRVMRGPAGSTGPPDLRDNEIRVVTPKLTLGTYEVSGQAPQGEGKPEQSDRTGEGQSVDSDIPTIDSLGTDGDSTAEHDRLIWKELNMEQMPSGATERDSSLAITPSEAYPNQGIAVAATLCNVSAIDASKTVSLKVDGVEEQSRLISVSAGTCEDVVFVVSRQPPGTYRVAIDGMTGEFTVLPPIPAPSPPSGGDVVPSGEQGGSSTATIVAIVGAMLILISALVFFFRRE